MARVIVDAQAARAIGKGAMIVFKKGVVRTEGEINPGDIVEVYTRGGGKFLGKGFATRTQTSWSGSSQRIRTPR